MHSHLLLTEEEALIGDEGKQLQSGGKCVVVMRDKYMVRLIRYMDNYLAIFWGAIIGMLDNAFSVTTITL